jgi:hypothetical protein
VKEGKNNKTFSDKRKPLKWQGEKRRFGEAFIKGKKGAHLRATHNIPSTFIASQGPLKKWTEHSQELHVLKIHIFLIRGQKLV